MHCIHYAMRAAPCLRTEHCKKSHRGMMWVCSLQLRGPDAHLVLSLQHLPQGQRRFATLGVLSCSDICAGLLRKLGPSLEPHQRLFLEQYKVLLSCSCLLCSCLASPHSTPGHICSCAPGVHLSSFAQCTQQDVRLRQRDAYALHHMMQPGESRLVPGLLRLSMDLAAWQPVRGQQCFVDVCRPC